MKIDQWVPVQRSSATCWIGNPSVGLILKTIPGTTNGSFASFSDRAGRAHHPLEERDPGSFAQRGNVTP